jgi:two-component system phosphate regulon response regulator OmpR
MIPRKPHLLVVDDDARLRQLLMRYLTEQGFYVSAAASAAEAMEILAGLIPDAAVVDVMMPGEDGLSFTRRLRQSGLRLPVLMLSALGEVDDRIRGLETGADDYLPKPFEPRELLLRIQSLLQRARPEAPSAAAIVVIGLWRWQVGERTLEDATGQQVVLTESEAMLLSLLAEDPGSPREREWLAERLPGFGGARSVDVAITRLRRKLGDDPRNPRTLRTMRGKGYALVLQPVSGGS